MRVGFERANTTLIASAAGVSIGSLYQYFPNKDAVVIAVLKASIEDVIRCMETALAEAPAGEALAGQVRRVVGAVITHKATNPRLHLALKTELGRLDSAKVIRRINERSLCLIEDLLRKHARELPLRDPTRAAFFAVNTVEGIVCAALQDAPSTLVDPAFARELSDGVLALLYSLSKTDRNARRVETAQPRL